MKEKIDWRIAITAIICLTVLEVYAMFQGINGTLFAGIVAVIAGLAGYKLRK